jgi:hypothetical protein
MICFSSSTNYQFDGQRFIINTNAGVPATPLTVITGWAGKSVAATMLSFRYDGSLHDQSKIVSPDTTGWLPHSKMNRSLCGASSSY